MNTGNVALLRLLAEFPDFVAKGTSPCSILHLCDPSLMQALLDRGLNINMPAPGVKTFLLHTVSAPALAWPQHGNTTQNDLDSCD